MSTEPLPAHASVIVSGENIELTDAIKSAVHERCEKLFHHSNDIINLRVSLAKEGKHTTKFVAKGHVAIYGPDLVVSAKADDLYKAITEMAIKLDSKLRKKYGKQLARRHNKHLTPELAALLGIKPA